MKTKSKSSNSKWSWDGTIKKRDGNEFPVSEFFRGRQAEDIILGPGGGAGIGCGAGIGLALVGGIGHDSWPWNHLNVVFGAGAGCGIGFGFGFGQGIGYGISLDDLKSRFPQLTSD